MVARPARGEIWWGELPDVRPRPFLVLTRDEAIAVLRRIVVAPVTRTTREIPTEVPLGSPEGLPADSVASFDNLMTVPISALVRRMGSLGMGRRDEPCEAIRAAFDC